MATTLHFPDAPAFAFVGQWCMPVPGLANLPVVRANGVEAQVKSVGRNASGLHTTIHCALEFAGGTTSADVTITGPGGLLEVTPTIPAWLDDVYLDITPENTSNVFRARFNNNQQGAPTKTGPFMLQKRFWSKFEESGGARSVAGVKSYVSALSTHTDMVAIDFSVYHANIDPSTLAVDGPQVFFPDMRINGLPAGYQIIRTPERISEDWSNRYAMAPQGGNFVHALPICGKVTFRVVICPSADVAAATAMLNRDVFGYTSGTYSFWNHPFGETNTPLLQVSAPFEYNGLLGQQGIESYFADMVTSVRSILATGQASIGNGFTWSPVTHGNTAHQWYFPPGWPDGNQSGGARKHYFSNYSNALDEWRLCEMYGDQQQARNPHEKVHPDTGETVTVFHLEAAHGSLSHTSWGTTDGGTRHMADIPAIIPVDASNAAGQAHQPLNDYTEPWNNPAPGNSCPYLARIQWWKNDSGSNFTPLNDAHVSRILGAPRTLIFCCDDEVSKDTIAASSAYWQFVSSPVPVDNERSNFGAGTGTNQDPQIHSGQWADLQRDLAWSQANPGKPGRIHRQSGESQIVQLMEFVFGTDTRRAELLIDFKLHTDIWHHSMPDNGIGHVVTEQVENRLFGPQTDPALADNDLRGLLYSCQVFTYHEGTAAHLLIASVAYGDAEPVYRDRATAWGDKTMRVIHGAYDPNTVTAGLDIDVQGAWKVSDWILDRPYYPINCIVTDGGTHYECLAQHVPTANNRPTGAGGSTNWAVTARRDRDPISAADTPYDTSWSWANNSSINKHEGTRALAEMYRLTGDEWFLARSRQMRLGEGADGFGTTAYEDILPSLWEEIGDGFDASGIGWRYSYFLQYHYSAYYEFENYGAQSGVAIPLLTFNAEAFDCRANAVFGDLVVAVDLATASALARDPDYQTSTAFRIFAEPDTALIEIEIETFELTVSLTVTPTVEIEADLAAPQSAAFDPLAVTTQILMPMDLASITTGTFEESVDLVVQFIRIHADLASTEIALFEESVELEASLLTVEMDLASIESSLFDETIALTTPTVLNVEMDLASPSIALFDEIISYPVSVIAQMDLADITAGAFDTALGSHLFPYMDLVTVPVQVFGMVGPAGPMVINDRRSIWLAANRQRDLEVK